MLDFHWKDVETFTLLEHQKNAWVNFIVRNESKTIGDISVVFLSDASLLEMNQKFLNHDYFTDIITFDYSDVDISGDLFISVDRVFENAESVGVSFLSELDRVIAHGVLHLCGYGDSNDIEKALMREKEDFYLNKLKGFT